MDFEGDLVGAALGGDSVDEAVEDAALGRVGSAGEDGAGGGAEGFDGGAIDGGGGGELCVDFGALVGEVGGFGFELGEGGEEGGGVACLRDGAGEVLGLTGEGGEAFGEFGALGVELGVTGEPQEALLFEDVVELGGLEDVLGEVLEDGCFGLLLGDAGCGAGPAGTVGADVVGAGVGFMAWAHGLGGEQAAAVVAADEAGEEVGGGLPAGVSRVAAVGGFGAFVGDGLDGVPGGFIDEGGAVVGEDVGAVAQLAEVDAVFEEGGIGVGGGEQVGGVVDLGVGGTSCAHDPGGAAGFPEVWVWDPAVDDVGGTGAMGAEIEGLADEADRGAAADGAVGGDEVVEAALDVYGEIGGVFIGHPVDEEFEDATGRAFGDGVLQGVDGDAAAAEGGFEELGVVEVAGEAVVAPEEDAGFGWGVAVEEVVDEGIEASAASGGGGGAGVGEDAGEGAGVLGAPGAEGGFLLGDGEVLFVSTGIAQVGGEVGARWEGVRGHFWGAAQKGAQVETALISVT